MPAFRGCLGYPINWEPHYAAFSFELERENRELRRANDILKAVSAFFAQEMSPRPRL